MLKPKKAKQKLKKQCKKKPKGIKVITNSTKYFESQEDARRYAIKLLESGLTFLEVTDYYEEEDC